MLRHLASPKKGFEVSFLAVESMIKTQTTVCTEPGEYLRVSVGGGGCSGYSYEFELTTNPIDQENDLVFEKDDQKVVTDVDSIEFMDGSTIDYKMELIKKAFVVTDNPLADQNCSCGSSFSIDL